MAAGKIRRAARGRRNRRRRRQRGRIPSNSFNSNQPLMTKVFTSQKYVTAIALDTGVGSIAKHIFSCNGLYDPDITGVGHQPLGFDQLGVLYDHYTVLGAKIEIDFVNTDTGLDQVCGISVMDDTTGFSDYITYAEQPRTRSRILDIEGSGSRKLIAYYSTKGFFQKKNPIDEDDLKGNASGNPTEQAYFHVWVGQPDGSDASKVTALVKITYFSVWHEPKTLAGS